MTRARDSSSRPIVFSIAGAVMVILIAFVASQFIPLVVATHTPVGHPFCNDFVVRNFLQHIGHGSFCAWEYGDSSRDVHRKLARRSCVDAASATPELSPCF